MNFSESSGDFVNRLGTVFVFENIRLVTEFNLNQNGFKMATNYVIRRTENTDRVW